LKTKRLRIFAGPNGSGKSTLYPLIKKQYPCGIYTNADEIENELHSTGFISFQDYQLSINQRDFEDFYLNHSLHQKAKEQNLSIEISYANNTIICQNPNSYTGALIVDFIRHQLVLQNKSFSFETVLSDKSKLNFLQEAKNNGYRVYLYFVATEDVEINIGRIKNTRVQLGGHDVPEEKIRSRYIKTLENLKDAVKIAHRAYIFDNSLELTQILDINNGTAKTKTDYIPFWIKKHLLY